MQTLDDIITEKEEPGRVAVLRADNEALRGIIAAQKERIERLEKENGRLAAVVRRFAPEQIRKAC